MFDKSVEVLNDQIFMNYLEKLRISTITTTKDNFRDFKITDSGLYILHPNFDRKYFWRKIS